MLPPIIDAPPSCAARAYVEIANVVEGASHPFGSVLRRYRLGANLTQEELAERAGVSVRGLKYLEQGARRPFPDTLRRLADALNLLGDDRVTFLAAAHGWLKRAAPMAPTAPPQMAAEDLPPFVGRAGELDLLERHLAGEGPPLLLLAGEPGIGKSRLVRQAVRRAQAAGWRVLAGGCQRRGGQEPYAPLLMALERDLQGQSTAQMREALRGCAWLVRLLPELSESPIEPLPGWPLPPAQERRLMFKAVGRYLANIAGPAGTVLVLDDLQWAGTDALDLLATLVRTAACSLRMIGAYRDTEVQAHDPLAVTLADLAHAGLAQQQMLAPLAPEEARRLLEALLDGLEGDREALTARLARRAGGLPFFLVSCAQQARQTTMASGEEGIPWDAAQGIRQRVAALPAVAQEVLGVAALIGRTVPPALLTAAVGQPEPAALAALDAACQARLLIETVDGYAFAHDLIREVVEAGVGRGRRLAWHRRIGETLEQQATQSGAAPPVAVLAYHFGRSDAQEKALLYLEQAGDQARDQAAHGAAEGYYRQVVARLEGLSRRHAANAVREKLGTGLGMAGHYEAALAELDRAADAYRGAGDLEGVVRVTLQIGYMHHMRGTIRDGIERVQPVLETVEAHGTSQGLAALYDILAWLFRGSSRYGEMLAASERAVALARAMGDARLLAESYAVRGLALFKAGPPERAGRFAEAFRLMEEAISLVEPLGDPLSLYSPLLIMAFCRTTTGEFASSRRWLERTVLLVERLGLQEGIIVTTALRAWLAFLVGEWDQARVDGEQAVVMSRQTGIPWPTRDALLRRGQIYLAEGRWEEASSYLEEAATLAARLEDLQVVREASSLLAELDLLTGRPEAARARLLPLLDRPGLEESDVTALLPVLAWAYLDAGDIEQADQMVALALKRARADNLRLALVDALRVQALVALRRGDETAAARALDEGLALARRIGYPYAEARLLAVYGMLPIHAGTARPAREQLEAALTIFRRLGARMEIEQTEQMVSVLGISASAVRPLDSPR